MKNQLEKFRKEMGLSMEKVGDAVGISASGLSKLEKGENQLDALWIKKFCQFFEVRPDQLIPDFRIFYPTKVQKLLDDLDATRQEKITLKKRLSDLEAQHG